MLTLLALAAVACPWHGFQTSLRDRLLADLTHPVSTLSDSSECLFDCSCKTPLSLMQVNLQLRFLFGIGLVYEIARFAQKNFSILLDNQILGEEASAEVSPFEARLPPPSPRAVSLTATLRIER